MKGGRRKEKNGREFFFHSGILYLSLEKY